jgi:CRISPR-associated exonuclease Cas4
MLFFAVLLLFIALWLFWQANRRRKSAGIPGGRIIYSDTQGWGTVEKPLYDPASGLTGKPDYIVDQGDQIIPVEVKSSQVKDGPYDSHIYQLAAYCLLIDRIYGKRPPYGIIHYPNRTYAVDYTPKLEDSLLDLLEEIRIQDRRKEVARSHNAPTRCQACGYRNICDQQIYE